MSICFISNSDISSIADILDHFRQKKSPKVRTDVFISIEKKTYQTDENNFSFPTSSLSGFQDPDFILEESLENAVGSWFALKIKKENKKKKEENNYKNIIYFHIEKKNSK